MIPQYALRMPGLTTTCWEWLLPICVQSLLRPIWTNRFDKLKKVSRRACSKALSLYRATMDSFEQYPNDNKEIERLQKEMLMNVILLFVYAISSFGEVPFVNRIKNSRNDLFTTTSGLIQVLGHHYKYFSDPSISETIKHTPPLDASSVYPKGSTPAKMLITESLRYFLHSFRGPETRGENSPETCQ